jgi:hypothetical protein
VAHIRRHWPHVRIVVRGDSGFCREHLMRWCEAERVDYLFGMAKNRRLLRIVGGELHRAQEEFARTGRPARVFKDFTYRTHKSWGRERRVVGKAEYLAKGANPRFVVTSLAAEACGARELYEREYCGRGDMENRIKEQQRMLFACRTSCATMRANQVRLALSTVAYVVLRALRQFGLAQTALAEAQCDTLRLKLLKLGAVVRVSVRRVWLSLSEAYPFSDTFVRVWENLRRLLVPAPAPAASPSG